MLAQGRWSEGGTLSRRAAAAGLAPDVKFSCGKAQLYFTVFKIFDLEPGLSVRLTAGALLHSIRGTRASAHAAAGSAPAAIPAGGSARRAA